jgi:hypothetical protein
MLRGLGIDAVYGAGPASSWPVSIECGGSPEVALALASAHRRVHGTPAAAHLGDGRFAFGDLYASELTSIPVDTIDALDNLPGLVVTALAAVPARRVELEVRFDSQASTTPVTLPAPEPPATWIEPPASLLASVASAERPMVIAGPGVVGAGAVADLHALATSADLGVLNTWGAKGIFDWRSRHHWATAGLQARDLELGGVPESDLVVLTGVDPDELDMAALADRPTVEVPPAGLGPLAERWTRPRGDGEMPELRTRLAAVTQAGWANTGTPLAPSQVTRSYALAVGTAGFVAANPGVAGYWVARTFATTAIGGAKVPARRSERGFAIAAAIVARLRQPGRRVLSVTDAPLDELDAQLLEAAERLGIPVALEVWDADGLAPDADAHASRVRNLVGEDRSGVQSLASDPSQLDAMIDAAGAVTAWGGLVGDIARSGGSIT